MIRAIVAIALIAFAAVAGVQAQTFPSRQINLIVPFPPGGSTDAIARIMAERMRQILGQPVIIENVGGAGGSIAVGPRCPQDRSRSDWTLFPLRLQQSRGVALR